MLKMDALQRKHFDEAVSSFLGSCTKYLLNNLPFDNQIIKYVRFFQPSLQQSIAAPNAISCLTLSIAQAQVLGTDEVRRYFKLGTTAAKFDLCDVVKKEFRECQTYNVEEKKDEESHEKKRRLQYSFFFCFFSRPFTIHRTAGGGGGHFFNSSLPFPPASQTPRH